MAKQSYYDSSQRVAAHENLDAYSVRTFPLGDRLRRLIWQMAWLVFYRPSPKTFHGWRSLVLRCFGARMGKSCFFYPNVRIWAPWNLECEELVTAADGAEIYNPAPLKLGSHAIVSQGAYLCGATHDFHDPKFPYLAYPSEIGRYAWICARAIVGPGVQVGEGAVLALGAVAVKNLEPWSVYGGNPAVNIKERKVIC